MAYGAEKRKLVEIVVLNFSLEAESLVPTVRKPFDMLVEGLMSLQVGATGRQLNFSSPLLYQALFQAGWIQFSG